MTGLLKFGSERGRLSPIAPDDGNSCPHVGEGMADCRSNPPGPAGYHGNLAIESKKRFSRVHVQRVSNDGMPHWGHPPKSAYIVRA